MKKTLVVWLMAVLPALGQTPAFEVASVKAAAPPAMGGRMMIGMQGGPETPDPTRYRCNNCPLAMLLTYAYDLKRFQITGPPWLDSERFEITAKVPEGATKAQARLMMQALLAERFGLKARLEKKEMQVYDLVVGKGGAKLKESTGPAVDMNTPMPPPPPPGELKRGKDGMPDLPAGRTLTLMTPSGAKHQGAAESMGDFAGFLAGNLNKPVTDSTGLTGKYDFTVTFSMDMAGMPGMMAGPPPGGGGPGGGGLVVGGPVGGGPGGGGPGGGGGPINPPEMEQQPTLTRAIQEQLGLRLDAKKGQADMLIIDHIEKAPTEN